MERLGGGCAKPSYRRPRSDSQPSPPQGYYPWGASDLVLRQPLVRPCDSARLSWYLSPNDKSRCFDWPLDELPYNWTAADIEVCVAQDGPLRSVLLVYLARSAEDQWFELTATLIIARNAKPFGRVSYDHDLRRERHYAMT